MTYWTKRPEGEGFSVVAENGTELKITSSTTEDSAVIAARVASMLEHHDRREALELGHTTSYSGSCRLPGVVGSDHVEDRPKLLSIAHQAEEQAELWDRYRAQVRKVLYPPSLVEIDDAPGIERYNLTTGPSFGRTYPRNARAIPQELREALLLATAYATENAQSYLDVAYACRQEHHNRYAAEDAAMREQAAALMADELGEE